MTSVAVVTAGGTGSRLKSPVPKQFIPILEIPLIVHTLRAFERSPIIDHVILVLPERDRSKLGQNELVHFELRKVKTVVSGGPTRQASVANGLEAIQENPSYVAIHDAARCLVTPLLIQRAVEACKGWDGAIVGLPVRDTLKRVDQKAILKTEPREDLWAMQTPQVFRFPFIRDAYRKAMKDGFVATDDAQVAEYIGGRMCVVEGSTANVKVTFEEDLHLAKLLLSKERH